MSFVSPALLGLLVLVPVLVGVYTGAMRRRATRASQLAAQGFGPTAATLRVRKRRHVPYAFFLMGITMLLLAIARPQTSRSIPRREGTVILAFDVSNSMRATDLKPTRMAAAKEAARTFVEKQPVSIKIGVVAFSNGGVVTQRPTNDKRAILAAINRLTPQGATSLGQGIFTAISAIAGKPLAIDPAKLAGGIDDLEKGAVDIGYFGSAAVVLLSDGENTSNPPPVDIAKLASLAGVKIYPIGIGSTAGTVLQVDGFSVATKLDEGMLSEIAKVSNGTYFHAEDEASLAKVYRSVDLKWRTEKKRTEVTGIATAISLALLSMGAALSLIWFGRMV